MESPCECGEWYDDAPLDPTLEAAQAQRLADDAGTPQPTRLTWTQLNALQRRWALDNFALGDPLLYNYEIGRDGQVLSRRRLSGK